MRPLAQLSVSNTAEGTTQGSIYVANSGVPSLTINYGLFNSATDSIFDELATTTRYFSFADDGSTPESIALAAGSTSGTMTLQSTNAVPVTFVDPTTTLALSEGGGLADTIAIESLDASFAGSLSVIGSDDTIDVDADCVSRPHWC